MYIFLFLFGIAIGSFLNVVIFRYDPDKKLFSGIGGRSHCMSCRKTLRWFELIPLFSFLIQFGRCRSCKARLSFQYPLLELITGLIFVLVPYVLTPISGEIPYFQIGLWLLVFISLLILTVVDLRLYIIPDGLNIFIGILALANLAFLYMQSDFGSLSGELYHTLSGLTRTGFEGSFLGGHAMLFFVTDSPLINSAMGAAFGLAFFGGIYVLTRGRGMGFGDVKLALPAGFLLGLPDMILATMLAFIIGALFGLGLMALKRKTMKQMIPFGPFIELGVTLVFFFGYDIVNAYFHFFNFLG